MLGKTPVKNPPVMKLVRNHCRCFLTKTFPCMKLPKIIGLGHFHGIKAFVKASNWVKALVGHHSDATAFSKAPHMDIFIRQ